MADELDWPVGRAHKLVKLDLRSYNTEYIFCKTFIEGWTKGVPHRACFFIHVAFYNCQQGLGEIKVTPLITSMVNSFCKSLCPIPPHNSQPYGSVIYIQKIWLNIGPLISGQMFFIENIWPDEVIKIWVWWQLANNTHFLGYGGSGWIYHVWVCELNRGGGGGGDFRMLSECRDGIQWGQRHFVVNSDRLIPWERLSSTLSPVKEINSVPSTT